MRDRQADDERHRYRTDNRNRQCNRWPLKGIPIMTTPNTEAAPNAMVPNAPPPPEGGRPNVSTVPTPAGTGVEIKGSLNQFRQMGGSAVDAFNSIILRETLATVWCQNT
jgi:hypothetical protein